MSHIALTLRKRDYVARAVFVSIVEESIIETERIDDQHFMLNVKSWGRGIYVDLGWIDNQHWCQSTPDSHFVDLGGGDQCEAGQINNQHGEDQQSAFHCPCKLLITNQQSWGWWWGAENLAAPLSPYDDGVATSGDTH